MTAVLFITDLHIRSENTLSEPNLLLHQSQMLEDVYGVIQTYRNKYEKVIVVFMGDIVDRDLSSDMQTALALWLRKVNDLTIETYSLFGNHEFSFKTKNNIFWKVAYGDNFETPKKYNKIDNLLRVEEGFKVDTVYFNLWHYNYPWVEVKDETVKEIVVASHNAMSFPGLKDLLDINTIDGKMEYVHYRNLLTEAKNISKLKYILFGHMHTLVGKFNITERVGSETLDVVAEGLGSLGRPSSDQFNTTLKRNIPAILVEDTVVAYENNIIELVDSSVLDKEEIAKRKEKYEDGKVIRELKKQNFSEADSLITLRNLYAYNLNKLFILEEALAKSGDSSIDKAKQIIVNTSVYS